MFAEMKRIDQLINKYPSLEPCAQDIRRTYGILKNCYQQGGKLLVCGNGGSAADSEHIVGELMKGFLLKREVPESLAKQMKKLGPEDAEHIANSLQRGIPAIALTQHPALSTAVLNDNDPYMVFAQQVYALGKPGDVL